MVMLKNKNRICWKHLADQVTLEGETVSVSGPGPFNRNI